MIQGSVTKIRIRSQYKAMELFGVTMIRHSTPILRTLE